MLCNGAIFFFFVNEEFCPYKKKLGKRRERKGVEKDMSDLYTGAMGMISYMNKLDVHSNNIANASTTGYKSEQNTFRVFEETYMRAKKHDSNDRIGAYSHQVYVDDIQTNFGAGNIIQSKSNLDFALNDDTRSNATSFFVVGKEGNTFYTRNGHFMLDANRTLSTANGGQVLDENGEAIVIPEGVEIAVSSDGMIVNQETNEEIAQLQLRSIASEDLGLLKKEYGGYYSVWTSETIQQNFGPINNIIQEFDHNVTLQGIFKSKERLEDIRNTGQVNILQPFSGNLQSSVLETSNVNLTKEMMGIINAQKGVQSAQKTFNTMDKILEKAANEIGR